MLLLPEDLKLPCDVVLLAGSAIVNEAMLTGESTPVGKTAVESSEGDEIYDPAKHSKFTLYAGTQLLQSKCFQYSSVRRARQMSLQQWLIKLAIKKAIGMVIRTGFSTTKGSLVRSILYSRPIQFKFYSDSFKFIGFLFIISTSFRVLNATRAIDKADSLSHTHKHSSSYGSVCAVELPVPRAGILVGRIDPERPRPLHDRHSPGATDRVDDRRRVCCGSPITQWHLLYCAISVRVGMHLFASTRPLTSLTDAHCVLPVTPV